MQGEEKIDSKGKLGTIGKGKRRILNGKKRRGAKEVRGKEKRKAKE